MIGPARLPGLARLGRGRTRYSALVAASAPTMWLRFNDLASPPLDNSYDSTVLARADTVGLWNTQSGSTVTNAVAGAAHPGTIVGNPSLVATGPLIGASNGGNAIDYDGDDYTTIAYNAAINTSTFSVGVWVYRDVDSGGIECLYDSRSSALVGFTLNIQATDKPLLGICNGATVISATGTTSIATGRWYHIVGTYDLATTTAKIYVDGVLEGTSAAVTITQNTTGISAIGRRAYGGTEFFNGKISRPHFHNAALTASEIGSLFVKGRPVADTQGSYAGGMIDAPTSATGAISGDSDACFDFDGSNDAVVIPYAAGLNAATFSIAGWIRRDADTGGVETIATTRTASSSGYVLRVSVTDKLELTLLDGAVSSTAGATSLATDTWYHVAATYDGTTARVYLNGVLDGSGADAYVANTSSPLRIGIGHDGFGLFNGKIDELTYYGSRVLTDNEIATQARAGRA